MGFKPFLFELDGCQIAQRLMRSFLIILLSKAFCENARLPDIGKEHPGEKLVAKSSVKTLSEPVLPGMPRLDISGLCLLGSQPAFERLSDEFWAVVEAKKTRRSVFFDQSAQDQDDFRRRQRS